MLLFISLFAAAAAVAATAAAAAAAADVAASGSGSNVGAASHVIIGLYLYFVSLVHLCCLLSLQAIPSVSLCL